MKNVPRIGRLLDLAGLVLFAVGGAFFARAWVGFQSVRGYEPPVDAPAWSAVALADGFWQLQKIGAGLMVAGAAVFVLAWWVGRAGVRRGSLPSPPLEP